MLRFSPGFYVGSMKNVPPALHAGEMPATTVRAPALTSCAFRGHPAGALLKRRPSPRVSGFNWFRGRCVSAHQHARAAKLLSRLHLHLEIRRDFSSDVSGRWI